MNLSEILNSPLTTLAFIAGLIFLIVGLFGKIETKFFVINPERWARVMAIILGGALLLVSLSSIYPAAPGPTPVIVVSDTPGVVSTDTAPPPGITNLNWNPVDQKGSSITITPIAGTTGDIKIAFTLKDGGWVAAYKKLNPAALSQTTGIKFAHTGTGASNTLELKLVETDETIFRVIWYNGTYTAGIKKSWEVPYSEFKCEKGTGRCQDEAAVNSEIFNPEQVDRIDFSFSNKPDQGDEAGAGEVIIEGIQLIR